MIFFSRPPPQPGWYVSARENFAYPSSCARVFVSVKFIILRFYCVLLQYGGQCTCKENVRGRRCDQCKEGTYRLVSANPAGCSPCMCHSAGVAGDNINCNDDGVCTCKDNVRGRCWNMYVLLLHRLLASILSSTGNM